MVQISLQNSGGKVVFYAWVPRNPPLGTNGGEKYLGHVSVNKHPVSELNRCLSTEHNKPFNGLVTYKPFQAWAHEIGEMVYHDLMRFHCNVIVIFNSNHLQRWVW